MVGDCCGNKCRHCPFGHFRVTRQPRSNIVSHTTLLYPSKMHSLEGTWHLVFWAGDAGTAQSALQRLHSAGASAIAVAACELSSRDVVALGPPLDVAGIAKPEDETAGNGDAGSKGRSTSGVAIDHRSTNGGGSVDSRSFALQRSPAADALGEFQDFLLEKGAIGCVVPVDCSAEMDARNVSERGLLHQQVLAAATVAVKAAGADGCVLDNGSAHN